MNFSMKKFLKFFQNWNFRNSNTKINFGILAIALLLAVSIGFSGTFTKKLTGTDYAPFSAYAVNDNSAGLSYSGSQMLYIQGYDFGSNVNITRISYYSQFNYAGDVEKGLWLCTKSPYYQYYQNCPEDYKTRAHKVYVKFMGEDWVITDMTAPTYPAYYSRPVNGSLAGGSVKLGKVSSSGIIMVNESFNPGNVKIVLEDVTNQNGINYALFSVTDLNGSVLKKDRISEGVTKDFVISGITYKVHVFKVAPGYTAGAKWADVAILTQELKLVNGKKPNPDNLSDGYYAWVTTLGWGYGAKERNGGLKYIQLTYQNQMYWAVGDWIKMPNSNLELQYNGNTKFAISKAS